MKTLHKGFQPKGSSTHVNKYATFYTPWKLNLWFSDVFRGTRKLRIWSHVENRWFSDVFRGTRKLRIGSHVLKKSLVENFIFCAVKLSKGAVFSRSVYSYIRTESGYFLIQPKYRTIRTRINFFFGHFSRREIPKIAFRSQETWVSYVWKKMFPMFPHFYLLALLRLFLQKI